MEPIETKFIVCNKTEEMENEPTIRTMQLEQGVEIIQNQHEEDVEEEEEEEVHLNTDHQNLQTVFAKFMEEKTTITYRKLVVPQSMRSIYWKFFGFPADDDGEILTRVKIVCLICKTQIAYNRNTSNLRMHLQNKHAEELQELEAFSPPRKQPLTAESKEKRAHRRMLKAAMSSSSQHIYTTNMDGTVHIGGDIQFVTDPHISFPDQCIQDNSNSINVAKPLKFVLKSEDVDNPTTTFVMSDENHQTSSSGKSISDAILEFVIIDLQLPEVVQEQGFQRLVATLKSPCQIPSRTSLEEEIIPKEYENFREAISSSVAALTNDISLAIEEWTSNSGESYFTFIIYYQIPSEASLESKMLCTIHGPKSWNEQQWSRTLDSFFSDWCIKVDKITAVVVSTMRFELLNALNNKGLTTIPCLLHSLQVCAQTLFENEDVAKVLAKCRTIIGAFNSHPDAAAAFAMQDQLIGLEDNTLSMDYPTVWTSTYTMLQGILQRREVISNLLSSIESLDIATTDIQEEQWQIINDLVEVLEPFKVTIMTLSEEKMPLISLLKPLLWQLTSAHLKVKEADSITASAFKSSLSQMLCDHYAASNVSLLLQIATTLDPRFKEVPYATDEDKKLVTTPIKEMLTKLIAENGDDTENQKEEEQSIKKPRLSGMEMLLGSLRANKRGMSAQEKADLELAQYQSESTAPLDNCPLQWWAKISAKCPNLGSVASRYNCVPVCCPPPSRIPSEVQLTYNAKRATLPPHLVDKLLFLHANYNLG